MTRLLLLLCMTLCAPCAATSGKPDGKQGAPALAKPMLPLGGTSTLARIEAGKRLRVGVAINAPWVMHDKNGELFGYLIDLARKIGEDMGRRVEIVTTSWPRLLYDLRTSSTSSYPASASRRSVRCWRTLASPMASTTSRS